MATPIGAGCKICDRRASPRRAFPMTGRPVRPDPGVSRLAPYSARKQDRPDWARAGPHSPQSSVETSAADT
ncbi:DUF2083 domain-containing protein [Rhodovulum sulfidophilum]|nr:DUF2083 domain-containing protein [Rhodovulum sulfidophilum]MCE8419125.1 DUF2083 domain-containing protein [Rhodovulum sulfidophilum]